MTGNGFTLLFNDFFVITDTVLFGTCSKCLGIVWSCGVDEAHAFLGLNNVVQGCFFIFPVNFILVRNVAYDFCFFIARAVLDVYPTSLPDARPICIVMAVGKAGEKADRDKLAVIVGGVQVTYEGMRAEGYDEGPVAAHMKGSDITIGVDVGIGSGEATVWTCDLTHGYISINADYRS